MAEAALNRRVFAISGDDRVHFLDGLTTRNPVDGALTYAALLTPQGKYLADFFLLPRADDILLDIHEAIAAPTIQRLTMYKLRANVGIEETALHVQRGLGEIPDGAYPDPRDPALGWRFYSDKPGEPPTTDWDAIRVAHCIPESGIELTPDSYILEAGFERLNGVDFKKGCYVGQEVTARMKHKTELRKGLATVAVDGAVTPGTEIFANGKPVGALFTQASGQGIAYLRFDRASGHMQAGDATVRLP